MSASTTIPAAPELAFASYEEIASEYYDAARHPTCANFREASGLILGQWLSRDPAAGLICEVGAGSSLLAELMNARGIEPEALIISDSSIGMLRHSKSWLRTGTLLCASLAEDLPLPAGRLDLLVSSLGDPYNDPAFWREVSRVLRPGGRCWFTTPSAAWATSFRSEKVPAEIMGAEFETSDSRTLLVPSWIYSTDEQVALIEEQQLVVVDVVEVPRSALRAGPISPKLMCGEGIDVTVATGYLVRRGC